jgi:hypothetical protein
MLIIAMHYLYNLIDKGIEFPDAIWKTSQRYQIDHTELELAYDQQFHG